jgi:choline dehydrogenase-like flavoprotein
MLGIHPNGTLVMGPSSSLLACVDERFRVHGIENLRVADLSVCPVNVKYVVESNKMTLSCSKR